jgi:hypothetical protein
MAGPWLYPISKDAGTVFILGDGTQVDVSLESFTDLVVNGRIQEGAWWYIRQNWRKIQIGDEVYIYTVEQDAGIIGYAIIDDLVEQLNWDAPGWYILLRFDLNKCRSLLKYPIPAETVREKWVHYPRKTVINLESFENEIEALLPWKGSRC